MPFPALLPSGYSHGGPILVCDRAVFVERWRGVDAPVDIPFPVPDWQWGSRATQGGIEADYDRIIDLGAPDFEVHDRFLLNRVPVRGGEEAVFCIAEEDSVGLVVDPAGRGRFLLTRGEITFGIAMEQRDAVLRGWLDAPSNVKVDKKRSRELLTVTSGGVVVGDSAASGAWESTETIATGEVPSGVYFLDAVLDDGDSSAIRLVRVPKNRAAVISFISAFVGTPTWNEIAHFASSDEWLRRMLRF
jgi:hypothetical protein